MQLMKKPSRIGAALCLLTANLLGSTAAMAQNAEGPPAPGSDDLPATTNAYDDAADDLGTTEVDSAVLFYKEDGGRVQAIEPMVSIKHTTATGRIFSAKITYDALTGASPNGATPYSAQQSFVVPAGEYDDDDDEGESDGGTGASGTVVINPDTGLPERIYTTPAGTLPVDEGFRDNRVALDLGFTTPVAPSTKLSLGLNGSKEEDYTSLSGRASVAQELNNGSTTLSLGVNYEYDKIDPFHGIPTPLTAMNGIANNRTKSKNVLSVSGGLTQLLTPNWLVQVNYNYGWASGYQTDPYKIVSVVDATTGAPEAYLYESRPDTRTRQSVYAASKYAMGSFVTDVSARYYFDDWGINSMTFEVAEHVPLGRSAYVEPRVRYYKQDQADFFAFFLSDNATLPRYVSADARLDGFTAWTFGTSAGAMLSPSMEVYGNAEYYKTSKAGAYPNRPGALSQYDLYAGTNSVNVMVGVKFKF